MKGKTLVLVCSVSEGTGKPPFPGTEGHEGEFEDENMAFLGGRATNTGYHRVVGDADRLERGTTLQLTTVMASSRLR